MILLQINNDKLLQSTEIYKRNIYLLIAAMDDGKFLPSAALQKKDERVCVVYVVGEWIERKKITIYVFSEIAIFPPAAFSFFCLHFSFAFHSMKVNHKIIYPCCCCCCWRHHQQRGEKFCHSILLADKFD